MNAVGVNSLKVIRFSFIFGLTVCFACLWGLQTPAHAKKQRKDITAKYNINFNGFGIGSLKLWSRINGDKYTMKAHANISVLAGILFEWNGKTVSTGRVMAKRPHPSSYSFGYRSSKKGGSIDVRFSNNNVKHIAVNPPQKRSRKRVPVTRKHMRNVVDPLSAIMMLTNVEGKKGAREVCTRRLPIFDGKARYDLKLTPKKVKRITTSYGYKGKAYVCKVKFQPIAGHKTNSDESKFAEKTEGIEIWMVPLAKAGLYVPYYIYIPTPAGGASMTASGFLVETPDGARGAFLQ